MSISRIYSHCSYVISRVCCCGCCPHCKNYTGNMMIFIVLNGIWRGIFRQPKFTHWSFIPNTQIMIGAQPIRKLKHLQMLIFQEVKTVIDCTEEFERSPYLVPVSQQDYNNAQIDYFNYPCSDNYPVPGHVLIQAIVTINQQLEKKPNQKILIHCKRGKGRAVSVALVFLFNKNTEVPIEGM